MILPQANTVSSAIGAQKLKHMRLKQKAASDLRELEARLRHEQHFLTSHGLDPIRDMNEIDARLPNLVPDLIEAGNRQIASELALREFEDTRHAFL